MRCPSCQVEAPDGQFYCPNCRASMYSYVPESSQSKGGRIERAGRRLLDLVLIFILIGVGVVLARAIKWREIFNGFKPVAEVSPPAKTNRESTNPGGKRQTANSSSKGSVGAPANTVKPSPAEGSGDLKQKAEDSPSPVTAKPSPKPTTATPAPIKKEPNSINSPSTSG